MTIRIYELHCANAAAFLVNAEIDFGKTLTNNRYCINAIINIQLNDDKTK
jgi:peptide methionine sulfoxide reductase MsrB